MWCSEEVAGGGSSQCGGGRAVLPLSARRGAKAWRRSQGGQEEAVLFRGQVQAVAGRGGEEADPPCGSVAQEGRQGGGSRGGGLGASWCWEALGRGGGGGSWGAGGLEAVLPSSGGGARGHEEAEARNPERARAVVVASGGQGGGVGDPLAEGAVDCAVVVGLPSRGEVGAGGEGQAFPGGEAVTRPLGVAGGGRGAGLAQAGGGEGLPQGAKAV